MYVIGRHPNNQTLLVENKFIIYQVKENIYVERKKVSYYYSTTFHIKL